MIVLGMLRLTTKKQFSLILLLATTLILSLVLAGFRKPKEIKKSFAAQDFRQAIKTKYIDYQNGTAVKVPGGNSDVLINESFTLEAWIKPIKPAGGSYSPPAIMCKAFTNEQLPIPFCLSLGVYYSQFRPHLTVDANGLQYSVSSTRYVNIDKWYHLAATVDADNGILRLYVNGLSAGEKNVGQELIFDDPDRGFTIGTVGYTGWEDEINSYGYNFDGLIDEVRISKGIRYKEDFVPSLEPFHPDNLTMALYNFDGNLKDRSSGGLEGDGEAVGEIEFVPSDILSSSEL